MEHLQRLLRTKCEKPLMGQPAIYAENATDTAAVRGDSIELYDQITQAATLILEETGVLLPMYHKVLFSDSAYDAIMKASKDLAAELNFSQMRCLEVWHSTHHFSAIRWMNRTKKAIDIRTLIAGFDPRFRRTLDQMETEAEE